MRNINWLEEHVGPIDATEVLLTFPDPAENRFFRRAVRIQSLERELGSQPGVVSAFSTVTFLPERTDVTDIRSLRLERIALEAASIEVDRAGTSRGLRRGRNLANDTAIATLRRFAERRTYGRDSTNGRTGNPKLGPRCPTTNRIHRWLGDISRNAT